MMGWLDVNLQHWTGIEFRLDIKVKYPLKPNVGLTSSSNARQDERIAVAVPTEPVGHGIWSLISYGGTITETSKTT